MTREPEKTHKAYNPSNAVANDRSPLTISQPAAQPLQTASSEKQQEGVIIPAGREDMKPFQLQTNNSGLPDGLRSGIEQLSGISMDSVKVHYNSGEPAQLSAYAYARDNDIHIGPGQEKHLPHEAWHVVQQKQGRVQPLTHINGNVPVNNDPSLEQEATTMGGNAMQMMTDHPLRSAGTAGYAGRPVTQLVQLPGDSTGNITRIMHARPSAQKDVTEYITGAQLQQEIIGLVKKNDSPGGYRLGTFEFKPGALIRILDPYPENHGMPKLPGDVDVENLDSRIKPLITGILTDAGQLTYLQQNWAAISKTHDVVIDVDCQFNRTQSSLGFHKDSRGNTLFFNLSFSNQAPMQGPDFYQDLIGSPELEWKLPEVVQGDIAERRDRERRIQHEAGGLGPIESPKLASWGRVSLSDANIYHSTPKMGRRNQYPPFHRATYIDLLVEKFVAQGDFRAFFTGLSDQELINWLQNETEPYNRHNSESISLRGQEDAMRDAASQRTRRLSTELKQGTTQQQDLDLQKVMPRTFIRTWVRTIPRPILASPMGYLGAHDKSEFNPAYPGLEFSF